MNFNNCPMTLSYSVYVQQYPVCTSSKKLLQQYYSTPSNCNSTLVLLPCYQQCSQLELARVVQRLQQLPATWQQCCFIKPHLPLYQTKSNHTKPTHQLHQIHHMMAMLLYHQTTQLCCHQTTSLSLFYWILAVEIAVTIVLGSCLLLAVCCSRQQYKPYSQAVQVEGRNKFFSKDHTLRLRVNYYTQDTTFSHPTWPIWTTT